MAGPNLEIFKFSLYLLVPLISLVHFGDPAWYRNNVTPYRQKLFPPAEKTLQRLPSDQQSLRDELEKRKAERMLKREEAEKST